MELNLMNMECEKRLMIFLVFYRRKIEDCFEPQTLKRVEVYTEMVPVKTWRHVNENHSN